MLINEHVENAKAIEAASAMYKPLGQYRMYHGHLYQSWRKVTGDSKINIIWRLEPELQPTDKIEE